MPNDDLEIMKKTVDRRRGDKWENIVDFTVRVPGDDFQFRRVYNSNTTLDSYEYRENGAQTGPTTSLSTSEQLNSGNGWSIGNIRGIHVTALYDSRWVQGNACPNDGSSTQDLKSFPEADISFIQPGREQYRGRRVALGQATAFAGPGNQVVLLDGTADSFVSCEIPNEWEFIGPLTITQPGVWRQQYGVRTAVSPPPVGPQFQDVLWLTADETIRGQSYTGSGHDITSARYYHKRTLSGGGAATSSPVDVVYLNGTPNASAGNGDDHVDHWDAKVELDFADYSSAPRLGRVRVYRKTSAGTETLTQEVIYYYKDGSTAETIGGSEGSFTWDTVKDPASPTVDLSVDADLGTNGDLIMVDVKQLQSDAEWSHKVTQYRYHDGSATAGPEGGTGTSGEIDGENHQLKLVIQPQQVEYASEQNATGTPDQDTVLDEALALLNIADSGTAFTDVDSSTVKPLQMASKVVDYADIEIDENHDGISDTGENRSRVERQYLQASDCGCGGGSFNGIVREYDYLQWSTAGSPSLDGRTFRVEEREAGSSTLYRAFTYDYQELDGGTDDVLYLHSRAVLEPDGVGGVSRAWATEYVYNSDRRVTQIRTPSSNTTYTEADPPTIPSVTHDSSSGLTQIKGFDSSVGNPNLISYGNSGNPDTTARVDYFEVGDPGSPVGRSDLVGEIERLKVDAASAANDIELIQFDYEFEGVDVEDAEINTPIRLRKVTKENGLTTENGPSGTSSFTEIFDDLGRLVWFIDEDGICTRYEYDDSEVLYGISTQDDGTSTGRLVKVTRNAEPLTTSDTEYTALGLGDPEITDPFSGLTHTGDELTTQYEYDLLGRVVRITFPGGVAHYTTYEMRADDQRPNLLYKATVRLPFPNSTASAVNRPITITWRDANGDTTRRSTFEPDLAATYTPSDVPPIYEIKEESSIEVELSRRTAVHDRSGQVIRRNRWWEIDEYIAESPSSPSVSDFVDTTNYEFDAFGRMIAMIDASGSRTERTFDVLDRVKTVKSGIDSAPTNLQLVAEYFYDGNQTDSPLADGVGNGNLTSLVLHVDGTEERQYSFYYDDRDRHIATVGPEKPYRLIKYDNLERATHRGLVKAISGAAGIPTQAQITTANGAFFDGDANNLWLQESLYDQQGRLYRARVAIDASLTSGLEYLTSDWWYGDDGDVIASTSPNSPSMQIEYDEHDRAIAVYATDLAHDADYADAASIGGATTEEKQVVLEQYEYSYATDSTLELATQRLRLHDDNGLGVALSVSDSVSTYTYYLYDYADRVQAVVDLGTTESGFESPSSDPTVFTSYDTEAELLSADDVLYQWYEYDSRGMVKDRKSPRNAGGGGDVAITRTHFDDAGRLMALIEKGYQASPTTIGIAWNNTKGRWEPESTDFAFGNPDDQDRVTTFSYDSLGNLSHRVAWKWDSDDNLEPEDTRYVYGVTTGSTFASEIDSNRLLAEVRYPAPGTGEPSPSGDTVKYKYNRLGELIGIIDQLGTERRFDRDSAGRVTADAVVSPAASIDAMVRAHVYRFDDAGRLDQVSAYDDPDAVDWSSSTIVNQVTMTYSPLWQLETVKQNSDGLTSSGGETVTYSYTEDDTNNHSRLDKLRYPSEHYGSVDQTVQIIYASGLDDDISRVTTLQYDDQTVSPNNYEDIVTYEYLGLGLPSLVNYPNAGSGISLDRSVGRNSTDDTLTQTAGLYPAFDRFGRLERQLWTVESITTGTTKAAYFDEVHRYDRASNRLSRVDSRHNAGYASRDQVFEYDNLNRLSKVEWGAVSDPYATAHSIASAVDTREWELDVLGNTETFQEYDSAQGFEGDYTVNNSNEYTRQDIGQVTGKSLVIPQPIDEKYTNDANGNRTKTEYDAYAGTTNDARFDYKYDAWNRLVKVEYYDPDLDSNIPPQPQNPTTYTVAEYEYNGLHWRTEKRADTTDGMYDGLDQERHFYYSASWQLLEEHVDEDYVSSSGSDRISQQFWGTRYIDDAVAKRIDVDADRVWDDGAGQETTMWYYITDSQFSVRQVVDDAGYQYERIDYTPYGEPIHSFAGDVNRSGGVNTVDFNTYPTVGTYDPDWDFNSDGIHDSGDIGNATSQNGYAPVPTGWISEVRDSASEFGPDNSIGYAGYVNNAEIGMYQVRFRVYDPATQRWMTRDPIRYLGGQNLYGYAGFDPVSIIDSLGLAPDNKTKDKKEGKWDFTSNADYHSNRGGHVEWTLCCDGEEKTGSYRGQLMTHALVEIEKAKAEGCQVTSFSISSHHSRGRHGENRFYSDSPNGAGSFSDETLCQVLDDLAPGAQVDINACFTVQLGRDLREINAGSGAEIEITYGYNSHLPEFGGIDFTGNELNPNIGVDGTFTATGPGAGSGAGGCGEKDKCKEDAKE